MIIQRDISLPPKEYFRKHLAIVNCLLPAQLTDKEIDVLSEFLSLQPEIIAGDMFNSFARNKVRKALDLSHGGLSNHLKSMKKKDFLYIRGDGKLAMREFLLPHETIQGYQIKLRKAKV